MPLIQWIMQNLQKKIPHGVEVGGKADKNIIFNALISGGVVVNGSAEENLSPGFEGVLVGGEATLLKLSFLIGMGGVRLGGTSPTQKKFVTRKRVDYQIGDFVYFCNQKFVVTGVRGGQEPIYSCRSPRGVFKFYQSQLQACPSLNADFILRQLDCLGANINEPPIPPVVTTPIYIRRVPVSEPACPSQDKRDAYLAKILRNLECLGVEVNP